MHLGHKAGHGGWSSRHTVSVGKSVGHTGGPAGQTEYCLSPLPGGDLAGMSTWMLSSLSLLPRASSAVLTDILEGSSPWLRCI